MEETELNQSQDFIEAASAPLRTKPSNYPETFAQRMMGRDKRPIGDLFGITQFGVNLTTLHPGAVSALHHQHTLQDEFIYVLAGEVTLYTGTQEHILKSGMCAGFRAGGQAHHLRNCSASDATYIEIGSRVDGDAVSYPEDDLVAVMGADGTWSFEHKNGQPY